MATATSIKFDDELKRRIQRLAEVHRRSSHWIMREAIAQYVEREERREALRQDTLKHGTSFRRQVCMRVPRMSRNGCRVGALKASCRRLNAASEILASCDP